MKKYKNKETGVIYTVNTKSIEEVFDKNPIYVEVKETKGTNEEPKAKKTNKGNKTDETKETKGTNEEPKAEE